MGFWSNVGEALFGTETKKQGKKLAAAGGTAAANAGQAAGAVGTAAAAQGAAAGRQASAYDASTRQSMGGNAAQYMQKANTAAQGQAEQAATAASTAGTQAALRASRSSGLNKGQAALAAGQQAGDIYSGTYQKGLETGRDQYQQATGQFASQGAQMAGRQAGALSTQLGAAGTQVGAASTQAGIGSAQQQAAAQTAQGTWGTIGTIAGAALGMSDEDAKTDIEEVKPKKDWGAEARKIGQDMLDRSAESADDNNGSSLASGLKTGMSIGSSIKKDAIKEVAKEAGPAIAAAAMSDEDAKTDINIDSLDIEDIAKKIRPVRFKYKKEIVESGKGKDGEHLGVIAQDLEKTPLAPAVVMGDDGFKRIDTTELSPAILNLVIQLSRKIEKLEGDK